MGDRRQPYVSWLWRTTRRDSGVGWWGERPTWVRHGFYWVLTVGLLSASAFRRSDADGVASPDDYVVVFALVGAPRTLSRSLALFAFLVGILAFLLQYTYRWGVRIEA